MQYSDDETRDPRPRWRILWKCIVIGLLSGLAVSLYRLFLSQSNSLAHQIFTFLGENPLFIPVWIILAVLAGFGIQLLLRKVPEVTGSGIPQVKGNIRLGHRMRGIPILMGRFMEVSWEPSSDSRLEGRVPPSTWVPPPPSLWRGGSPMTSWRSAYS
ncbi:MAG: hypothetical protein MJZ38_04130 [archaeon]|nr:hypothetical protein [archaeon]